jgi:hypothetical protein
MRKFLLPILIKLKNKRVETFLHTCAAFMTQFCEGLNIFRRFKTQVQLERDIGTTSFCSK